MLKVGSYDGKMPEMMDMVSLLVKVAMSGLTINHQVKWKYKLRVHQQPTMLYAGNSSSFRFRDI